MVSGGGKNIHINTVLWSCVIVSMIDNKKITKVLSIFVNFPRISPIV